MIRTLQYNITTSERDSTTVMEYLRSKGFSRRILTSMKPYPDSILLNGQPTWLNIYLKEGDCLVVTLRDESSSSKIVPVKMDLHILYEDEDILVVHKPADTPIHPSQGNHENTLANGIAWYYGEQEEEFVFRSINRLDRDTTGALILAKNALSASILGQQMMRREIHRTYLAWVEGIPPASGTIDAPIGRVPGSALMRQVDWKHGEKAITHYRLLESNHKYSLVEINLETGRTHQIRVHMKHIGHPLPGDYLYNPNYQDYTHQPLHSWKLEFHHPITGQKISIRDGVK